MLAEIKADANFENPSFVLSSDAMSKTNGFPVIYQLLFFRPILFLIMRKFVMLENYISQVQRLT
ncbi:MAG: hypothetical protein AB7F87_00610 [Oligoflexales bacterium]